MHQFVNLKYTCLLILVTIVLSWPGMHLLGEDAAPATVEFFELLERAPLVELPDDSQDAESKIIKLSVGGRILDETGQPIADSVVILRDWFGVIARTRSNASGECRFENIRSASSTRQRSGDDGSITIANVVAANSTGRMNWTPVQYFAPRSSTLPRRDRRSLPNSIDEQVDITLAVPRALTGFILDSTDHPVPDVQVRLDALIEFDSRSLVRDIPIVNMGEFQTISDAEGHFSFPHIPAELVAFLQLTHPNFFPTHALIRTSPDAISPHPNFVSSATELLQDSPAQLHLDDKVIVQGKVVNRSGDPLAGAVIRSFGVSKAETSDERGNFSIEIAAKRLRRQGNEPIVSPLTLSWPKGARYVESRPEISRQQIIDQERVTIVAEGIVELRGRVIDTSTHQPVAHVPLAVKSLHSSQHLPTEKTQTDDDGRFAVRLREGRWLVTYGPMPGFDLSGSEARPDFQDAVNPKSQRIIDLFAGKEPANLVIGIDPIPAVVVHVVDSTGKSVAAAKVRFLRDSQAVRRSQSQGQPWVPVPDGITNAAGNCEFQLPTLFNENWIVTARSPADTPHMYAAKELRSDQPQKIELRLAPGMTVRGRVLLGGDPLTGAKVSLAPAAPMLLSDDPNQIVSTSTTDGTGTYELSIPPQREWTATGVPGEFKVKLVGLPAFTQCMMASQNASRRRIEQMPQQEKMLNDFKADFALGKASGAIVDEHDNAVVGAIIRANPDHALMGDAATQAIATTDEAGAFQWIGLGPGKFRPLVMIDGVEHSPHVVIEAGQNSIKIVMPLKR